jgi:hypothetical protein
MVMILLLLAGCHDFQLSSTWKDRNIVIDGKDTEWQDCMSQEGSVYLGVCNDADYLYLCLSATGKATKAQLMGLFKQSFTVWFDPQGKGRRAFGVRFSNESPFMNEALVNKVQFLKTPEFQIVANEMIHNMEIEVLKNNYPVALLADAKGIDVAAGMSMNGRKLTFEFRVPLKKSGDHPFAIEAMPGKPVSIGVETSPMDMDYVLGRLEKSPTGSGYRITGRESAMNIDSEAIGTVKLWGKVTLAAAGTKNMVQQ